MKTLMLLGLIIGLSPDSGNSQVEHMNHGAGSMEFGVSGGLNIASNSCVLQPGSEGSAEFAYGFVGNIFVDHQIMPYLRARIGIGIVNGGSDTEYPINGVVTSFKVRSTYLDVPLLVRYDIATFGHHTLYAVGGANFGYLISAKTNDVEMENMRDFDVGLLGGFGMAMPMASRDFFMEAKYAYGLANTSDLEGEELKNRGIRLTAGITF